MKYKYTWKIIPFIYYYSLQWKIQLIQPLHVCVERSVFSTRTSCGYRT